MRELTMSDPAPALVAVDNELRVDSRLIAEKLDILHVNLLELVDTYSNQVREFGFFRFETEKLGNKGRPMRYVLLNENQCYFIGSLCRNSSAAVAFKMWLVKAFDAAKKQLRESAPAMPAIPTTLREALLLAADLEAERERLAAEVSVLAPKAAYTDTVLSSVSEWTTTTIAKELGMSAVRLNAELYRLGIQYQNSDGAWVLYAKHQANGYTKTRTHAHADSTGAIHTKIYTVWTEKGRKFIHDLLSVPA